ncbi:MAG: adenine deaminase [Dehalococcoidia bacterium]
MRDRERLLAIARGDAPAELLLANARVVNTFNGEIEEASVAVSQGLIVGVGDYGEGNEILDLKGKFLAPGFIDGHIHLESSHLSPAEYARAVVPRGVLGVVTDFHEIANVCGVPGIEYILNSAENLPMDVFGMAPSCVPATHMETSGAELDAESLKQVMKIPGVIGLGEMMNFPGVMFGDVGVWDKLELFGGKVIDGHCPGLRGNSLNAYLASGIRSDHECTSLDEAREKLSRGMYIMIREGSAEKNLETLLPLLTDSTFRRCFFVVDDRDCADLLRDGDVDAVVRKAIGMGLDPVRAIQMATINTAEYFRLERLGAVAPGYRANLIVFDDLNAPTAGAVYYDGKLVAEDGKLAVPVNQITDDNLKRTVNIKPFGIEALRIPVEGDTYPVIELIPGQIVTEYVKEKVEADDGYLRVDVERDILKLAVVERHKATGNIGLGLVRGFGIRKGAFASSIAHDSHNIVAVGASDEDILAAVEELKRIQGGIAVAEEGRIISSLALPVAGLISEEPLENLVDKFEELRSAAAGLGCKVSAPFAVLSFLALPVIPELKLTDMGLVDVLAFQLLDGGC